MNRVTRLCRNALFGTLVTLFGHAHALDAPCGQLSVSEGSFVVVVTAIGQRPIRIPCGASKTDICLLNIQGKPASLHISSADGERLLASWSGPWPRCIEVRLK